MFHKLPVRIMNRRLLTVCWLSHVFADRTMFLSNVKSVRSTNVYHRSMADFRIASAQELLFEIRITWMRLEQKPKK